MLRAFVLLLAAALAVFAQAKKIVVTGMSSEQVQELRSVAPQADIVAPARDAVAKELLDADALIGGAPLEAMQAAKHLKWLQVGSAGVERYLHLAGPWLRDSDIILTNAKIIQGPEIADHAMALLLYLTRDLAFAQQMKNSEVWSQRDFQAVELRGKTAVVIGVGGIGTQIAARANAFGMTVIGVDPKDIPFMPFLSRVVPPDRLDEVLPEADVVFVSAPHTPQSENMMGPKQFELMKQGSYFIAVSRGHVYSMDGLVHALDSRKLAGAGVDVTNPEPLPKGHPLWKFPNVVITPHVATRSDNVNRRRMDLFKDNLHQFVNGEPLRNVVDKQKGY